VCRTLAAERVQILALTLDVSGQLRLLAEPHGRARAALEAAHHRVSEGRVLVATLPHVPGGVASILRQVADAGINVEYAYASTTEGEAMATVVLGVEDAVRAADRTGL
jgi:hypothetical protein